MRRLREWPHDAYRDYIVDKLRQAGASPEEINDLRTRMIVRLRVCFVDVVA